MRKMLVEGFETFEQISLNEMLEEIKKSFENAGFKLKTKTADGFAVFEKN